jgi:hypothetical protein
MLVTFLHGLNIKSVLRGKRVLDAIGNSVQVLLKDLKTSSSLPLVYAERKRSVAALGYSGVNSKN